MKAELLSHQRIDYDDGAILEMKLWRVPVAVPLSRHGLKYSLFYGRPASARLDTTTSEAKAIIGMFGALRRPMPSAPWSD